MGNPPQFDRARRNVRVGPAQLPATGREGPTPKWPLAERRPGELQAWRALWRSPQAIMWEKLNWTRTVARYTRVLLAAEENLDRGLLAEARQLETELGLTPKSMRLMLWTIVGDPGALEAERPPGSGTVTDISSRIPAVDS